MSSAHDPALLGRYRIAERVARGSFGRVLRVIDGAGDSRALKIASGGAADRMLLAELEALARVEHPSLPRVFEVGRTPEPIDDVPAGAPFFVAEWVAGGRCDARPWDDARALWSLIADVAGALAAIHAAGLVHGDVAPGNVVIASDGRAVLVDLGLAAESGARGTPGYMAPEAFGGLVEPASDLYSLGALAASLVLGKPAYDAPTLGELAQQILAGKWIELPGVPRALAELIRRLMARDPAKRPASAIAVLDELDALAPSIAPDLARRARPDRADTRAATMWPVMQLVVDAIASGIASSTVVHAVVGGGGSGARELVDAAVRRWQLAEVSNGRTPARVIAGGIDELVPALDASGARWIDRAARALRGEDAIAVVELTGDPRAGQLVAALARAGGARPVVAIVDDPPALGPDVIVHAVPRASAEMLRALAVDVVGREPPAAWVDGLLAASGGLMGELAALLGSIANEPDPFAVDWTTRSSASSVERRAVQLAGLSPAARQLVIAAAAWGGRAPLDALLGLVTGAGLVEVAELERTGLARRHGSSAARAGGDLAIDRATVEAALASSDPAPVAVAALALPGVPLEARASLLVHAPLDAARTEAACDVADELLARGRADRARALAEHLIAGGAGRGHRARAALIAARAAAALGAYRDVEPLARIAQDAGADRVEAQLVVARAAQRAGDLDAAEATLAALHAGHPDHADVAGTYARLLVTRSRFDDARRIARAGGPLAGLRAEAAGLAAFYLGELDEADRAFAALEASGDGATIGRALSLRGMVAQQRGQLGLASERYREAARRLDEIGEVHAAATAELNLGTALAERGRASEALPRLAAASRVFAQLGATTEQIAADLNRGNALVAVGLAEEARAAAEAALARAGGSPHLRAFALIVLGDARRRLGDAAGAERAYRDALAIGRENGDAHAQISAYVALAEAGHGSAPGVAHAGRSFDGIIEAVLTSDDDRDRWTIARGRLDLADPDAAPAIVLGAARACADVATRAAAADRLERAFRAHAVACRLAQRAGDAVLARTQAERARAAHTAIVAAAAPAFRAALDADPDLAGLPAVDARPPALPSDSASHLRRLLTLSRRLNVEPDVDRILDEVIDTAIELTAAERGFLLLRQPNMGAGGLAPTTADDGVLAPVVSRNFAMSDLASGDRSVSRSIAERAAQTGEPVLTVDAGIDERFAIAASVAALRLRSVLAVPLRQRGQVTGCIYVDHRLRGGAFDDAAATVLGELADIAAIAIENARLTDDLRRTTREVEALNQRLGAELAERDAELVRVKADLPDRDRLRHRYERIVGRAPATVRMLEIIDRAAATSLPVVIVGESGTGKELVARALHDNGPRKDGPFVAINCSAVPEPLLESELFGHVRGSFTGADRDRRGLFEVADGGTLFLDEIADTSPAMQAKLLRVLQDGMVRRVGDSRTRKVDVRVVAASQRPLAELAADGRFREDLRFRLEVILIPVPPLRDRDGDLPLLIDHLLAQLSSGKPPRVTRAALRALTHHRWPGNVRELENALARGVAMGGDGIDVGDLPDAIGAAAARPEPAKPTLGDDLRLKPALASTEQAYISAAMDRAKGNQTVAARLLGLSRFGLQKKLRRLAGDDTDDDS